MASDQRQTPKRSYPRFWERAVPVVVGIIGVLIVAVLAFVLATALGWLPGIR